MLMIPMLMIHMKDGDDTEANNAVVLLLSAHFDNDQCVWLIFFRFCFLCVCFFFVRVLFLFYFYVFRSRKQQWRKVGRYAPSSG
jgi:hypothetical protein